MPNLTLPDLLLMMSLGFFGSFGHCASMCGPVAVAFGLTGDPAEPSGPPSWQFHGLLNLGRLLSYGLVGAAIGGLGEALVAGGQLAGVGSELRRWMAVLTGSLLIWLGLVQISPGLLPAVPLVKLAQQQHQRLSQLMVSLSLAERAWTPLLLGLCWGMIPCGFLYTAQIRAVETGSGWAGALLMLAFGLGTAPTMLGVGWVARRWSEAGAQGQGQGQTTGFRASQLSRLGGWVTLVTGLLLLLRRGDSHGSGAIAYGSLVLLMLALAARPLAQLGPSLSQNWGQNWGKTSHWSALLRYRRGLGVGAFTLALVHILQIISLNWDWNWRALDFLIPQHRQGVALGLGAWLLMLPAALTSFDRFQQGWGRRWRQIHLLTVPALGLALGHTLLLAGGYWLPGSEGFGGLGATLVLVGSGLGLVLLRSLPGQLARPGSGDLALAPPPTDHSTQETASK